MFALLMANVPAPRRTNVPVGQAASAALIAAADAPLAMVDPHCFRGGGVHGFGVLSPSGNVAGSPAVDQSSARLGARMPDHGSAKQGVATDNDVQTMENRS